MKALYVTASCLDNNTSANMSHNAYIQGLIENGVELDIIMASDSWGESDSKLHRFEKANYYIYNSLSIKDRVVAHIRRYLNHSKELNTNGNEPDSVDKVESMNKLGILRILKGVYSFAFRKDPVYLLHQKWLKRAKHFKNGIHYDMVISNSSPEASHKLVKLLSDKGRIRYKRWVQIWEDPWYYDVYGVSSDMILEEEHDLLKCAQEVYYVSPLTLHYQRKYFPDCSGKMRVIPLPSFVFSNSDDSGSSNTISFGYFGDYYSHVRNLLPFYEALKDLGYRGFIYGDSDLRLQSNDSITVSGRVTLDLLESVQNDTSVLVHLSNVRGGQIPGKIYHYSATTKPILFILDGTEEEQRLIKEYFSKYNRFIFCSNTKEDIIEAMKYISQNINGLPSNIVESFYPKEVVSLLLNDRTASNDSPSCSF